LIERDYVGYLPKCQKDRQPLTTRRINPRVSWSACEVNDRSSRMRCRTAKSHEGQFYVFALWPLMPLRNSQMTKLGGDCSA
jgi:hypothetical protein